MSLQIIQDQIEQFLSSDSPQVIAIKGTWGSGKTYAWKQFLTQAKERNRIATDRYSYISLFGVDSLEDFKYLLFQQAIPMDLIGREASLDSFKTNAIRLADKLGRKSLRSLFKFDWLSGFAHAMESLAYLSVSNYLICIDDLERKGRNLAMRDILGLVSALKEEKNCKIVIIQNDGELDGDDDEDYRKYREKVIDIELRFQPTAAECASVVLDANSELDSILIKHVAALNIDNIRVVKKIKTLSEGLNQLTAELEDEIRYQTFHSLTLFTWCFYGPKNAAPSLDYLKKLGYSLYGVEKEDELTDDKKRWNAYLQNYNFLHMDELDLAIAQVVETGYVVENEFLQTASEKNSAILASKGEQSFSDIWRLYHDSFDDNQEEFVAELCAGIKKHARYVTPFNLSGAVRVLRGLGRDDLADKAIDDYIEERSDEGALFDLSNYSFAGEISDARLVERFEEAHTENAKPPTLREGIDRIAGKGGWGSRDEKALADASEDDYYELFRSEKGKHLSSYVNAALQFGRFSNASDQQRKIGKTATSALIRLGKESAINALRVAKFGVDVFKDNSASG